MPFNKFYYLDSNNDQEVSFILELTSLLQTEFKSKITLSINSKRDFEHLINHFNWVSRPVLIERPATNDECWIDLTGSPLNDNARKHAESDFSLIVSSDTKISGKHVSKVSSHLLNSTIKYPDLTTSQAWAVARAIARKDFYEKDPHKTITIVLTNEVNEWISLIEASASIIAYWYRYQDSDTRIDLLDLSGGIQKSLATKVALTSECLVVVKISPTTAQFIKLTRNINPDCKMIIHGFESSSVYFANTFLYGIDPYLYQQDLWIMSCQADAELAKESWKNLKTVIVPLRSADLHRKENKTTCKRTDVYYFGRISEQKNLLASIFAIALLAEEMRKESRKFKIFGYEDFLGVPNLRIPSQGCLEELYFNVKKLGITDLVEFHPKVNVTEMEKELTNGVFLSPSIHSDENFGLVAYRALRLGTPVILSEWGGHRDLAKYFSGIEYVTVYETKSGPEVNPHQIAEILLKVWKNNPEINVRTKPFEKLSLEWSGTDKLESSALKIEIVNKIKDSFPWTVRRWPLYGKIFKNHLDPNYLLAQKHYGARKLPLDRTKNWILSPLVTISEKQIKIKDSRLGVLRFVRFGKREVALKQLGMNEMFYISSPECNWLWENGYIYFKGEL